MTLVNADTGEVVASMTPAAAREMTDRIRTSLQDTQALVIEAFQHRVWEPLGYDSWQEYVSGEFDERPPLQLPKEMRVQVHQELVAAEMSTRAAAATTGSSHETVRRDLAGVTNVTPDEAPQVTPQWKPGQEPAPEPKTVTGTDGKKYPAKAKPKDKPQRAPFMADVPKAAWNLRKSVERLEAIAADDRFAANKEQVAAHWSDHLTHAVKVCQDLLDSITEA